MLLLAIKQPDSSSDLPLFPSPPDYLSLTLKIGLIILSLILLTVVFWLTKKYKLGILFNGRLMIVAYVVVIALWIVIVWLLNPLIPLIPVFGYKGLGLVFLGVSVVFIVAVFWKWLAKSVTNIIDGRFQVFYWIVFWLVYVIGWLKGLSGIPPQSVTFPFAFYIGFIWFLIIAIIMLKSTGQIRRK
jgi:hypothetical protein